MKVLLVQDVDNLGLAGEVKEVTSGYGRNYLIPKGLAVLATPGAMKEADLHRRRATERRDRIAAEMAALAEAINQTALTFQAKAGEKGRLYGSVTSGDIADKLADALGQEVDRRKIVLESPIKQLGTHRVNVRLGPDLTSSFDVVVESIEPLAEEQAAMEEAAVVEEATTVVEEPAVAEEMVSEE